MCLYPQLYCRCRYSEEYLVQKGNWSKAIRQTGQFFVPYNMQKPNLDHTLFWDTDLNRLDWKKNANAIIVSCTR